MSSTLTGFNQGYNLTYSSLADFPAPSQQLVQATRMSAGPQIQMSIPLTDSQLNVQSVGMLNYSATPPQQRPRCSNAVETATWGASVCIRPDNVCVRQLNSMCPQGTRALNQFTGEVSAQPLALSPYNVFFGK
jgi:hypothetical protein